MTFTKGTRVRLTDGVTAGVVVAVVPKADGVWAEQFYVLKIDGNDLFEATLHESALTPEANA